MEDVMKTRTWILAGMVLLVPGMSSAISGPCTTGINDLEKTLAAHDAGSGPTSGATSRAQAPASPSGQHPPTAVINQETQGKATSPDDARRQTEGAPTAAQQGNAGTAAAVDKVDEARKALQRARSLDAQGKEAECMQSVREARDFAGSR
jgi:hypothetical protein